ncbi:collagen binding domain-containing protein [Lysinibacillus sp. NPDC094177]|uniref:collagen binding domain-containing protein n=1 Tax=Lysinibacillus sp. NPDC094177 TaxID=3390580 RepID=UPI003D090D2C
MRKFKKLNIAIILMLLVFQTVLSPISVFAAEGEPPAVKTGTDTGTGSTGGIVPHVTPPAETGGDAGTGSKGDAVPHVTPPAETGGDAGTGTGSADELPPPAEAGKEDGTKADSGSEVKDSSGDMQDETTPPKYDSTMSVDVIKNVEFTVGEAKVNPNDSIKVTNGQSAEFKFYLELAAGHNYGPGTTLTYTLPAIFEDITFPNGTAYGEVGTISKNGNNIVITFNDELRDSLGTGVALEPGAYFMVEAKFSKGNMNWDETISLPGTENIELNFQPSNNGTPVFKSGKADNGALNSESINWKVDVNTDLGVNEASGTTNFVDTLIEGEHTFKQDSVKITKFNVLPNGTLKASTDPVTAIPTFDTVSGKDRMTIKLPNEKYTAYHIEYQTEVGDPGNVKSANFKNEATYNGESSPQSVTVNFGDPLAKTHEGPTYNDLATHWTINYNFNKRNISSKNAVLTDVWPDTQELDGDVLVFMEDGTTPADISSNVVEYKDKNKNGFKLSFDADVTKPYVIKYKTKPKANVYPTEDYTVTNTVTRSDMEQSVQDSTTYSKNGLLLYKSKNGIDYHNKTMSWKIVANQAGYNLAANTVFTDTFTDKNLTLKEDTLVVKVDNTPLAKDTDYTLTNKNDQTGFEITLKNPTNKLIEITYDTDYDIRHVGENTIQYRNEVKMTNSILSNASSDWDEQAIRPEQKANGKKEGYYDYATKTFYWDVELNFNYNSLEGAVFEDKLPDTQKVQNIVVKKGELNANGDFVEKETLTNIKNTSGKANEIKLELGNIDSVYKVTYESVDTDSIFPHGSPVSITNTATLTSAKGENASWSKTVDVSHTDKILNKKGKQAQQGSAVAKWNFEFNYAQSILNNVVITDTVGKDDDGNPEQMILEDTFKIYKVALSGITPSDPTEEKTLLDPSKYTLNVDMKNGTYTLDLGNVTGAYYVEYETVFTGPSGTDAKNEVEVSYQGSSQTSGNDSWSITNFKYGNQASTVKVPFVIVKTNAATGEVMKDVEFTLYSEYTGDKPLISAKTGNNGVLDFGLKLAEGNYILKETKVPGFNNPDVSFTLNRDEKETSGTYTGNQIIEIKNEPEGWTPDPEKPVDPNKPNPDPEKPVDPNKPNPDPEKPVDPNKPNPDPEKPVDPNKPNPNPNPGPGPNPGPNPDPEKPVDPNKPNPDPEKPVDPNKPNPDPEKPVDPNKPNPDPEKPVDPNKPNPDPEKPVDPNKPNPDPEKPVDPNKPNPDPEKPVDPNKPNPDPEKPVDPNKPNPDPEKPVDPNKPNPDPEKPVDPNKPNPGNSGNQIDPKNPTNPGKPSVQEVIDQGKDLKPYNPSTANKDTLDAYKDFLDKYNKLSKEEQDEVAKSLDIDKIKADANELEAQLKAKGKLPQTNGANQTALTLIGVALVLGALFLLRRRNTEVK